MNTMEGIPTICLYILPSGIQIKKLIFGFVCSTVMPVILNITKYNQERSIFKIFVLLPASQYYLKNVNKWENMELKS
jgi:hypothetical protein